MTVSRPPVRGLSVRRVWAGLLALLVVLGGLAGGQVGASAAADTGSITGTVRAAGGGPLADNQVFLEFRSNAGAAWTSYDAGSIATNASGVYTVGSLPAGQYRVRAGSANELDPSYVVTYHPDVTAPAAATPVSVGAGQQVSGVDIVRSRKPSISGTVTGAGGASLGWDWTVEARRKLPGGGWGPAVAGEQYANGVYRIFAPEAGDYAVRFTGTNHLSEYYRGVLDDGIAETINAATTVAVGPASSPVGINAQLRAYSRITGTVTKEAFAPTGSFGVEVLRAGDRTARVAYRFWTQGSIPDNTYSLDVPPGDYIVRFEGPNGSYAGQFYDNQPTRAAAKVVSVPLEATVSGIDAHLRLRGTVTGTVSGVDGAPVSGVRVYAYRDGVVDPEQSFVTTDAQGRYTLRPDPGELVVRFRPFGNATYAAEFYDDKRTLAAATRVSVTNGASVVADATLERRGGIHGVVLDPSGAPLANASVRAVGLSDDAVGDTVETDAQGRYALDGLVEREYKLVASHPLYADTYFNGARTLAGAQSVVVPAGAAQEATWRLGQLAGVSGRVVDSQGQPVAGVQVSARSYVDDGVNQFWHVDAQTATAADGTYTLRARPGGYTIFFERSGFLSSHYPDAPSPFLAETVVVNGNGVVRPGHDAVLRSDAGVPAITTSVRPTLSGTARAGETLTVVPGTWAPSDVTLHYRWSTADRSRAQASGTSLTLTPAMVGSPVVVHVIATKPGYRATSVTTARTALVTESSTPAVTNIVWPTVTGTAAVGETLRVDPGEWSPTPTTLTYQWYAGPTRVDGATASTYTPQLGDVGLEVSVWVTAGAAGHLSGAMSSPPTDEVTFDEVQQYVRNVDPPAISGSALVGRTLDVSPGTWDPADAQVAYQWLRDGAAIPAATGGQHTVTAADAGARLSVRVVAERAGYVPATVTTSPTSVVPAGEQPVLATGSPVVGGTALIGKSVSVRQPGFATTPQLGVQWLRQGKPISGATRAAYRLQKADAGKAIAVRVVAVASGYRRYDKTSKAVTPRHQVTLRASGRSPQSGRAVVSVALGSPTASGLAGRATVAVGRTKVGTVAIKRGTGKVTLKGQPRGRRTYTITFAGTRLLAPAARRVTITVR